MGDRFSGNIESQKDIRSRLEGADVVPLTMSLVQSSGDVSLLDLIAPYVRGAWAHQESVPVELASQLRDRMCLEIMRLGVGGAQALGHPPDELVRRMMSVAVGENVPAEYVPMLIEHTGMLASAPIVRAGQAQAGGLKVAVIGAGASGLAAAVRLGEAGFGYTVFEKNQNVGGTWFENRYPGCAVDTPNHFYQYSFEPNNDWPNYFSSQPSIESYLSKCADKYHVREHIRFSCEVESAIYDSQTGLWALTVHDRLRDDTEVVQVNAVICAVGQLNRPMVPDIPGLARFEGPVMHTAEWPEDVDLRDKRVGLVGTGASAIQVGPAIVDEVASLHVFQRSGAWVMRRPNIHSKVSEDTKWVLNHVPQYAAWYRFQLFWAFGDGLFEALKIDPEWQGGRQSISPLNAKLRDIMVKHIRRELEGRDDLIDKVIPDYPPFGKRVLGDTGWYKMLRREHVHLVTAGIKQVCRDAVVTADGSTVPLDAIVLATGFQAGRMLWPMDIRGRSGKSIREVWGDDNPRAFLGISAVDFPNLFIMYGPNTNLGHGGSAIFLAECQARYTIGLLNKMREKGVRSVEIKPEVHDRYNAEIDEKLRHLAWSHPSVNTWYKNSSGRIITNQPWRLIDYWRLTYNPSLEDYEVV